MLTDTEWMIGIITFAYLIIGCMMGMYFFYISKKTNARLLSYYSLAIIAGSLIVLAHAIDFLTIIFTGDNMNLLLHIYISMIFALLSLALMGYVGAELLTPKKKKYFLSIIIASVIIILILTISDPLGSFSVGYPSTQGENLLHIGLKPNTPMYFVSLFSMIFLMMFLVFGYLFKSIKSIGILRKKYLILSIGNLIFFVSLLIGLSLPPLIVDLICRIGFLGSFWLFYLGLREEPVLIEKTSKAKDIKVESSLFRIAQRPDQVTEEEVSISKEKKICLVCKSKVLKYNVFICSGCDTFYCHNCAHALEDLENACWVCNEPIDESKPTKPFKIKGEDEGVEIAEKIDKKIK